ncbi:tRNA-splicing endonuclease subunit Sen2 isoform X1 [Chiloscyllium plagiosum]|uniref:tRNA-splicing endonuclease subunit Sen2 isoform X1 n=1 Tax=Chiloscyllium plagiosum TaxID=36176 RepID=UPI001CB815E6|nr:tRNA-splicing endonuclease subunit Sen2 isoform X1 [Chiloscyllium plagiosum]XP_043563892.1 tRNA-splicing endonuclease subunit Sen2 isoform X1 [Chiloscyllium plagiosum]XP_043563893.1 tRNA-splicing endonuclease subunit Sen2 isoform X1 [Chiloscyllium plagiosum]XP_043563894.1 tRNA-splicing endonuclease subunit Sen2 isoform X1 [Chiloscyllium plagiosum]XP_043563895.1 tRNA-splicing endonuclease subunit Sen2 isoform X1 [Chiloscyllium plagiosum]XP_043563896.1 tRNA-splicing endonuclease subunit Sen2 
MSEANFRAPKRKRRVYESYEAPFPVRLKQEETTAHEQEHYYAEIINNNVIVRNPDNMQALFGKGYFGKGVLSRSRPNYNISDPTLAAKWKDANLLHMPIISSTKFQHHFEWAKSLLQEQGLEDTFIEKMLENYTKPIELSYNRRRSESGDHSQQINSNSQVCTAKDESGERAENTHNGENQPVKSTRNKAHHLESDALYDPLAKYGHADCETAGREARTEGHCPRHDDLIIHCGCQYPDDVNEGLQNDSSKDDKMSTEHEYVLVVENTLLCDGKELSGKPDVTERLVCKRNPFRVFEYLQLSLEEAFFLVYALGCLTIYHNEEPLTILKLWEVFSLIQPGFKTNYMGYHYFRSKGWVPKTGLKYGTDLLLYRKGPPFYHASYSVVIEMLDNNYQGSQHRPFTWRSLGGLSRTTANVSKELLLCYLIKPSDMTDEEMASPECMKKIKVQELIVSRWISSRERTDQEEL